MVVWLCGCVVGWLCGGCLTHLLWIRLGELPLVLFEVLDEEVLAAELPVVSVMVHALVSAVAVLAVA